MLWALMASHLVGVLVAGVVGRTGMRRGLAVAAVPPAVTAGWAVVGLGASVPAVAELVWVDGLDLSIRLRADGLSLLMTVLVSGIGALVFVYAAGYFASDSPGGGRLPPTLLAFSASMLGLVLADSTWTLFIFWELTSITSFLLVGHRNADEAVRLAARRALLITGGGGLALLAGLLLLQGLAGTSILTDLGPVQGTAATVAAVLVLLGAVTKSAQVPFHVWLPGAMAAPTPVSAYLHSATMVKAGVLLVALTGGVFVDVMAWKLLGLAFGVASMLWGAIGALRHRDAKLILAWGTVSQLGLLFTLLSVGTAKAVFAAMSILVAHALFKAALFLVVGEIDVRTGTRDIAELGGLARSMPVATGVAVLAGLSMAGVPPLLGFAAKEAAVEAVLGLQALEAAIIAPAVVGGSVLTVAYTVRFLVAVFGPGPDTEVGHRRLAMTVPASILAAAGLVGFIWLSAVNAVVQPAAAELNPGSGAYALLRWPGLTLGLAVSLGIIAAGAALGLVTARRAPSSAPMPVGAEMADAIIDRVLWLAPRLTARIQHGSLPVYLTTMALAAIVASIPLVLELSTDHLVAWDHPLQAVLGVAIVAAALAGAFVSSRLGAALTLGAVGLGVSGVFVLHGAPDLALTQVLVETVIVVGFVLGLGHLARRFPPVQSAWRTVRLVVSVGGGLVVMLALAAAGANPTGSAPIEGLTTAAVEEGGGKNVVNVVLTDIRALDTLGEVVVLAVVAVGILALANVRNTEVAP